MSSHLSDVNLWSALIFERHPHNAAAARWWVARQSTRSALFCRVTQSASLRISTGRAFLIALGISRRTNDQAWQSYDLIQQDGRVGFADEPPGIEAVWKRLSARATGSRTSGQTPTSPHSPSLPAIGLSPSTKDSDSLKTKVSPWIS